MILSVCSVDRKTPSLFSFISDFIVRGIQGQSVVRLRLKPAPLRLSEKAFY